MTHKEGKDVLEGLGLLVGQRFRGGGRLSRMQGQLNVCAERTDSRLELGLR
jgi:hypothetical protein